MKDAMGYEYLIRKAYGVGRHGVDGADADIFRRYERKLSMYEENLKAVKNDQPKTWNQPIGEMAFEAGVAAGKVAANVHGALAHVKNIYEEELSDDQCEELEQCGVLIITPTKNNVEEALERIHHVFSELNLQMR